MINHQSQIILQNIYENKINYKITINNQQLGYREWMKLLSYKGLLNDEIMNSFILILTKKYYGYEYKYLNTYFYTTFCKKFKTLDNIVDIYNKQIGHLLLFKKIFIPILKDKHWSLLVINSQEFTCHHYCSLHWEGKHLWNDLKNQLLKVCTEEDNAVLSKMIFLTEHTPLQNNGNDCGVYCSKFIEYVSENHLFDGQNIYCHRIDILIKILMYQPI